MLDFSNHTDPRFARFKYFPTEAEALERYYQSRRENYLKSNPAQGDGFDAAFFDILDLATPETFAAAASVKRDLEEAEISTEDTSRRRRDDEALIRSFVRATTTATEFCLDIVPATIREGAKEAVFSTIKAVRVTYKDTQGKTRNIAIKAASHFGELFSRLAGENPTPWSRITNEDAPFENYRKTISDYFDSLGAKPFDKFRYLADFCTTATPLAKCMYRHIGYLAPGHLCNDKEAVARELLDLFGLEGVIPDQISRYIRVV